MCHRTDSLVQCVLAIALLLLARIKRDDPPMALTGSQQVRAWFGWACTITAGVGFFLEGIGGFLHNGNFFLQLAHETMYLGFFAAGVSAILESKGRLPTDSWRLAVVMAFWVEGLVFYGHSLEQRGIERVLHFIMVGFSWATAACFLVAVIYPTKMVPQVMGLVGMLSKGIWFFVISDIL